MLITVSINCETISEFYTHLTELQKQIKKESKRLGLSPGYDSFPNSRNKKKANLSDNNCYGTHEVSIKPDKILY